MILIADSGSTKVIWRLLNEQDGSYQDFQTLGLNCNLMTSAQIAKVLESELRPFIEGEVKGIYFYGAGVSSEKSVKVMEDAIEQIFGACDKFIASDMLSAAIALCGSNSGIAAILGTGSNSCFYNGSVITESRGGNGYILSDEGGGASMGKRLVADFLASRMPAFLSSSFADRYSLDRSAIIEAVYRQPMPNRFLAQFTYFLAEHRKEEYVQELVANDFDTFLRSYVSHYDIEHYPVNFVGSIAFVFLEELFSAVERNSMRMGKVLRTPMEGLTQYHLDRLRK